MASFQCPVRPVSVVIMWPHGSRSCPFGTSFSAFLYFLRRFISTNELKDGDSKVAYVSVNDLEQEKEMK